MGYMMPIRRTASVIDKINRDGREFGHVTENLRDALLAGAPNVEFGIHGLREDAECVARRTISDDGDGMPEAIARTVYSGFSESATTRDFAVNIDPATCEVSVTTIPVSPTDKYHSRSGMGGRSTLAFNTMGNATVTIHQGVAIMLWQYRTVDGMLAMREWRNDEGKADRVTCPYPEKEEMDYDWLDVDRDFARVLLITSGVVTTARDADELIDSLEEGGTLPNPFFGIEWDGDVIPQWIVDHFDPETALAYRTDGDLAHGTVKMLMGTNPWDSTALTGDPTFLNERDYAKYNGAGTRFWLDLSPWNVTIQVMTPGVRKDSSRKFYRIRGEAQEYRFQDGSTKKDKPHGRTQVGALAVRRSISDDEVKSADKEGRIPESPVEYQKVLDLGDYGQALVILRDAKHGVSSDDFWATSRKGMVAAVYGNEIHPLVGDADDLDTKDYVFRRLGIPTLPGVQGRVSVFFFLPRASDTEEGVYQAYARDRLKWKGRDELPLHGEDGIYATFGQALNDQGADLLKVLYASVTSRKTGGNMKSVKNLWRQARGAVKEGADLLSGKFGRSNPAHIADGTGTETGDPAGPQGRPGAEGRDPCKECGQKIHAKTCSKYKENPGGGGGGTDGEHERLNPDGTSKTGRESRAKIKTPASGKPDPEEPNAPIVEFTDSPPDQDNKDLPATFTKPATWLPETGMVVINRKHLVVKRLYGVAHKAKRDETETVQCTEDWIASQVTKVIIGTLSAYGQSLTDGKAKWTIEDLGEGLEDGKFWVRFLAGLYMEEASLSAYVKGNAAVRRTASKRPAA